MPNLSTTYDDSNRGGDAVKQDFGHVNSARSLHIRDVVSHAP